MKRAGIMEINHTDTKNTKQFINSFSAFLCLRVFVVNFSHLAQEAIQRV